MAHLEVSVLAESPMGKSSVARGHHRALLKLQAELSDLGPEGAGSDKKVPLGVIVALLSFLGAQGFA